MQQLVDMWSSTELSTPETTADAVAVAVASVADRAVQQHLQTETQSEQVSRVTRNLLIVHADRCWLCRADLYVMAPVQLLACQCGWTVGLPLK